MHIDKERGIGKHQIHPNTNLFSDPKSSEHLDAAYFARLLHAKAKKFEPLPSGLGHMMYARLLILVFLDF